MANKTSKLLKIADSYKEIKIPFRHNLIRLYRWKTPRLRSSIVVMLFRTLFVIPKIVTTLDWTFSSYQHKTKKIEMVYLRTCSHLDAAYVPFDSIVARSYCYKPIWQVKLEVNLFDTYKRIEYHKRGLDWDETKTIITLCRIYRWYFDEEMQTAPKIMSRVFTGRQRYLEKVFPSKVRSVWKAW